MPVQPRSDISIVPDKKRCRRAALVQVVKQCLEQRPGLSASGGDCAWPSWQKDITRNRARDVRLGVTARRPRTPGRGRTVTSGRRMPQARFMAGISCQNRRPAPQTPIWTSVTRNRHRSHQSGKSRLSCSGCAHTGQRAAGSTNDREHKRPVHPRATMTAGNLLAVTLKRHLAVRLRNSTRMRHRFRVRQRGLRQRARTPKEGGRERSRQSADVHDRKVTANGRASGAVTLFRNEAWFPAVILVNVVPVENHVLRVHGGRHLLAAQQ